MGHTVGRPLKTWSLGLSNKFPARGVPGEGPDCHVPKVIVRFKPIPARILKFSIFILALSSRSLLRKMACLKKTSVPENTWRVARVHEISLHRSLLVGDVVVSGLKLGRNLAFCSVPQLGESETTCRNRAPALAKFVRVHLHTHTCTDTRSSCRMCMQ